MLIKSIEIKNFRCFHNTKVRNFSTVNLFGGKNNSGKTALLEALLIAAEPSNKSIDFLLKFRRIDSEFIKKNPEDAWDNFFYNHIKDEPLQISALIDAKEEHAVSISYNTSAGEFLHFFEKNEEKIEDEEILTFVNGLKNERTKSTLSIQVKSNNKQLAKSFLVASSDGMVGSGLRFSFAKTQLIPASMKLASDDLAKDFDNAKFDGMADKLLKVFKLIDNSIDEVDTFNRGKPAIYLKRKEAPFMPLSLFGDAMNKVANFILQIINNKESIILIDEIENGIHHSNQEKLWKILFDLAKEFNVQIFATSHSAEMIEAFKNVSKQSDDRLDAARYFELSRHFHTNEIIAQKIPIDVLEGRLSTKKPVRGE